MKRMTLLALGLACLGVGFNAAAGDGREAIKQIAKEANVSTRSVQMVLGNRTAFAEYRTSYDRVARRVHAAAVRLAMEEQDKSEREAYLAIAELSRQ